MDSLTIQPKQVVDTVAKTPHKEKVKQEVCSYLKEGLFKKDAAAMAGIDESTLYRWMESDASFASRVEANVLEYKRTLIKFLNYHAMKSGKIALAILARRWPSEWSATPQLEYRDSTPSDEVATAIQSLLLNEDEKAMLT